MNFKGPKLHDLKPEYKELALKNAKDINPQASDTELLNKHLSSAFLWETTTEGFKFWRGVRDGETPLVLTMLTK